MNIRYLFFLISIFCINSLFSQERQITLLESDWKFTRTDDKSSNQIGFDDGLWENVRIPHDWAISGSFDINNDLQRVKVLEDGEQKIMVRTGRTGSLPFVGVGWYRKELSFPKEPDHKKYFIEFDGAMSNAVVYMNGEKIGEWPYGYSSFSFELTNNIKWGEKNVLSVRLENEEESSRWYPGAGIYRNVRLLKLNPVHIGHWGTYVTTPDVTNERAQIRIETVIENQTFENKIIMLKSRVLDKNGNEVGLAKNEFLIDEHSVYNQKIQLDNPDLWDIEQPNLYTLISEVWIEGKIMDEYKTAFGIRKIEFDNKKGFFLNGRNVKIQGVCMHHDLGPLGTAVNYRATERQLELLKSMGCNAIRTSHNPPSPELLNLCDKMGFLVVNEAFDEWKEVKCKNGYNKLWDKWAEKDLTSLIHRDRNHPSVILWSIGNEIREQNINGGAVYFQFLTDICHREDPTRLVTAGFHNWENSIRFGSAGIVDVPGWNYKPQYYGYINKMYPQWKMYGSETASTLSSRGEYFFPVEPRVHYTRDPQHCSSYDIEYPRWATTPDKEFAAQDSFPFIAGEFVWTGFDYLGEPTPYNWPSHSSYFGIIDLGGIPKDRFYLYQSKWTNKDVLHILPHWTWPDRIGKITPVCAYTSFPSAELFVNGKSMGVKKKNIAGDLYDRYRLVWTDVKYEPGEIKVIAFDANGKQAKEAYIRTAKEPYKITLSADKITISANHNDLSFITVSIKDKNGNLCPRADNNIQFRIEGCGFIRGVVNGDPTNIQRLTGNEMKTFNGQCVLVVQSTGSTGEIIVKASTIGLKDCKIKINAFPDIVQN